MNLCNFVLSLGVITPLLFTMLVIMALVTTFITSPMLEWTYPKQPIDLDLVALEEETAVETQKTTKSNLHGRSYLILVPVANPSSQKGLVQLAAAIAINHQHPAIVHPLSLIELEEDYAFESTPVEAERLIARRRLQLEELVERLEPPIIRSYIHPIVRSY